MGLHDRRSDCPIAFALDVFGDRWTLLVIRDLLLSGKSRFSEIAASDEQMATNVLADRLKRLEDKGLLERSPDPEDGRKVLYSLTKPGQALGPAMLEILRWGARFDPDSKFGPEFLERLDNDREGLIREMREQRKAR